MVRFSSKSVRTKSWGWRIFTGNQRALDIKVAKTSTVLFFYYQKLLTLIENNPLIYIKVLEAVVKLSRAELKVLTGV